MKRFLFVLNFICVTCVSFSQADTAAINDTKRFQNGLVAEYADAKESPLSAKAKKTFKGIHFYPFNAKYVLNAKFVRMPNEKPFQMSTSSGMRKTYIKYAQVFFTIDGKEYKLNVYQSQDLLQSADYKDYLFIPFTDATSGKETYEGGRYIDLNITNSDHILINFNKAYHPYCAYTDGYNCPIPPQENNLSIKIEAGVKF
ncbi:MAG TPA: DUF1684 domain-containing protein [Parafilimonas sp.]|jgi:hypothetical protein